MNTEKAQGYVLGAIALLMFLVPLFVMGYGLLFDVILTEPREYP